MLATIIHGAKDLRLEEHPEPEAPTDDQVLLRFGAGGICGSDLSYFNKGRVGDFRVREPLCLGHEFSGEVVEVGRKVLVVGAQQCHRVSRLLDFRTAAMAEPLAVALHALQRAGSLVGKEVLITGGGPIGCLVMLALP